MVMSSHVFPLSVRLPQESSMYGSLTQRTWHSVESGLIAWPRATSSSNATITTAVGRLTHMTAVISPERAPPSRPGVEPRRGERIERGERGQNSEKLESSSMSGPKRMREAHYFRRSILRLKKTKREEDAPAQARLAACEGAGVVGSMHGE